MRTVLRALVAREEHEPLREMRERVVRLAAERRAAHEAARGGRAAATQHHCGRRRRRRPAAAARSVRRNGTRAVGAVAADAGTRVAVRSGEMRIDLLRHCLLVERIPQAVAGEHQTVCTIRIA